MGSVPNCQKEIPVCHAIRWLKCKLKPPKKVEEIPTKKAHTQPEIPLEVLLQDPDNQLLDIPVDNDDEDLPDVQIN